MNDIYDNHDDVDGREDRLIAMASRLSTEISPQRDLWPDIAVSISTPKRSRWMPVFAQAAAVVLLVGASSSLTYLAVKDQQATVPVPTVVTTDLLFEATSFGGNYSLGSGYQDARGNLASKLDRELERLSPESRSEVEKNMRIIRDAISEINVALEQEPDNVLLQELLLSAYRDELRLMQRVGGLTNRVMKRNDI